MKIKKALIPTALALGVLLTGCGDKKCDSHDYGDWSTIKAPTCKEEGSKERVCKNCGEKETETLAKLTTHTFGEYSETPATCATVGKKERVCSVCGEKETETLAKLTTHTYGDWGIKESTCESTGSRTRTCSVCGNKETETIPANGHSYTALTPAKEPTFLEEGNIAYYGCSNCSKKFDSDKKAVDTVIIPKVSNELVLLANNQKVGDFTVKETNTNSIKWELANTNLTKGDVITIAAKADNTVVYTYTIVEGSNLTDEFKVHNNATAATVSMEYTTNGLKVGVSGYKHDGVVLNINGVEKVAAVMPVTSTQNAYLVGFITLNKDDVIAFANNDIDEAYGYDCLDDQCKWNTFDFHRGNDGELVIDTTATYLLSLSPLNTINIAKSFAPIDIGSVAIRFEGDRADAYMNYEVAPQEEAQAQLQMLGMLENTTDYINFIQTNGYAAFTQSVIIKKGEKFNIFDDSHQEIITSAHLASVYDHVNKNPNLFTIEGDYIKALVSGKYLVTFSPYSSTISIKYEEEYVDARLLLPSGWVGLDADSNNIVTYNNFTSTVGCKISYSNNNRTNLAVTLEASCDPSVCHVIDDDGFIRILFEKAGNFNLTLNLNTLVLMVHINSLEGVTPLGNDVSIFVSTSRYSMYTSSNNKNELYCSFTYSRNYNISIGVGSGMTSISNELVIDDACKANMSITQGVVRINEGGNITLYLNKFTRRLRYVKQ